MNERLRRRSDDIANQVLGRLQLNEQLEFEADRREGVDEIPLGNGPSQCTGKLAGTRPIGNRQSAKGELAERARVVERRCPLVALDRVCQMAQLPKRLPSVE